jgi:hypothetical protein
VKAEGLLSVEVYNFVGQQVMVSKESLLDLSSLMEGIYFIRVVCEGGMITKQIVKQ